MPAFLIATMILKEQKDNNNATVIVYAKLLVPYAILKQVVLTKSLQWLQISDTD